MKSILHCTLRKSWPGHPAVVFLLLACSGSTPSVIAQEPTAPSSVISKMTERAKQGRYDEAITLGVKALQNKPSDEAVLEEIAITYLIKAEKDPANRQEWIKQAFQYESRALSIEPTNIASLYTGARSYEAAGDLSTSDQCAYYRRAREILQQRFSMLQGDEITLDGKHFALEPLRNENTKILEGVKTKMQNLGCK